jgi:hypothetical protein
MREAGVRGQLSGVSCAAARGPVLVESVRRCAVQGCGNVADGGEACARCLEELPAGYQAFYARQDEGEQLPAAAASRLENFAWASVACVAWLYLLWSLRGFWIPLFQMWTGGR